MSDMEAATARARETAAEAPSELHVRDFAGSPEEWDRFVRGREGWTHCHLHGWRKVIRDVFGHDCPYLAARDASDRLRGVLPLVRVRSRLFGDFLVSMPFLNYGGPVGMEEAVDALTRAAAERAEGQGVDLLELRSRRPLPAPADLHRSKRRIAVVLDLPDEPDALWEGFDPKVRNQVRKPRKKGVEVAFGPDQLEPFFQVFSRHMRDIGSPTHPRRFFEAIGSAFPEEVRFGCAYHEGEPVAAGCGLVWEGEFEITWAAALLEHRSLSANMLLYWNFMERSIREGLVRFNFGRCPPGSGTHRFKRQWGGDDEELWWYQRRPSGEVSFPSEEDSLFATWAPDVWRRLPRPVADALGPRLRGYLPA